MLGKLLKHDMRSMSKSAVPIFISSGVISVVCCAMLYFTFGLLEEDSETLFGALSLTGSFYFLGMMAILAMWAIVAFLTVARYYKSLFTDEGYLNMVLPVKTVTLFNSKLLSSLIWFVLSGAVAAACMFIALVLPTLLYDMTIFTDLYEYITTIAGPFEKQSALSIASDVVDAIAFAALGVESVVTILTAVTIGAALIKKHKVLGSILFYFAINLMKESVTEIASEVFEKITVSNPDLALLLTSLFALLVSAVVTACMYFAGLTVLSKKFNIE